MTEQQEGNLILDDRQIFETFLSTLHSKETRKVYRKWLNYVTKNEPASFLHLARNNRWNAQEFLISWILSNRDALSPMTVRGMVSVVRSLCDYAEIELSWKKISRVAKKVHPIGKDEPVPFSSAQRMYDRAGLRLKWILGLFMSGIRVGAFDSFYVKHLEEMKIGDMTIGILRVYPGEPEEYFVFLTPEALENWHEYKISREMSGEIIGPNSPLVRNSVSLPAVAILKAQSVSTIMTIQWKKLFGENPRNFKQCHGFRKLFRTRIKQAGCDKEDAEHMLGHKDAYYKPDQVKHLIVQFSKYAHVLELSKASEATRAAKIAVEEKQVLETNVMTEIRLLKLENEKKDRALYEIGEKLKRMLEEPSN